MKHLAIGMLSIGMVIFILPVLSLAATVDEVVAYIDDRAITRRELDIQHSMDLKVIPSRTRVQTLEAMINTRLMLQDAQRLRLSARDDTELLRKYLDLKVRAAVMVRDRDVALYFKDNRARFGNKPFQEVKAEIRKYLEELHYNTLLKAHISTLRKSVRIIILE